MVFSLVTVLVKHFAHLNGIFFLDSLEEIGIVFKVSPPPSGGSQEIHDIKCAELLTSTVLANYSLT